MDERSRGLGPNETCKSPIQLRLRKNVDVTNMLCGDFELER